MQNTPSINLLKGLNAWESGELDQLAELEFFSSLLRTGMINHLQGTYGRTAIALVRAGLLHPDGTIPIRETQ